MEARYTVTLTLTAEDLAELEAYQAAGRAGLARHEDYEVWSTRAAAARNAFRQGLAAWRAAQKKGART